MVTPPFPMIDEYYKTKSALIPEPDRQILTNSFESRRQEQGLLPERVTPEIFVGMISDRIYTEISRKMHVYVRGIEDADVQQAYGKWVDDEVHSALKKIPINIDSHDKYSEVRKLIVQEVAARAILLFSRWKGTSPAYPYHDTENLRSELWSKLAPKVPEGAKIVRITMRNPEVATELMTLVSQLTGKSASVNHKVVLADFELEDFPQIWQLCKLHHIPNTSLTFS